MHKVLHNGECSLLGEGAPARISQRERQFGAYINLGMPKLAHGQCSRPLSKEDSSDAASSYQGGQQRRTSNLKKHLTKGEKLFLCTIHLQNRKIVVGILTDDIPERNLGTS